MGGSFTPDLKRLLIDAGCRFVRPGKGDHEIWFSPHTGIHFPVDQKMQVTSHSKRSPQTGRPSEDILERMHLIYQRENLEMAYTMEDFLRETHELVLANMTPEERLKGLDPATIEAWLAKQRRDH